MFNLKQRGRLKEFPHKLDKIKSYSDHKNAFQPQHFDGKRSFCSVRCREHRGGRELERVLQRQFGGRRVGKTGGMQDLYHRQHFLLSCNRDDASMFNKSQRSNSKLQSIDQADLKVHFVPYLSSPPSPPCDVAHRQKADALLGWAVP